MMESLCQIMVRVKDAELQKLRSQVKNLENNLERTTEVRTLLIRYFAISVIKREVSFILSTPTHL